MITKKFINKTRFSSKCWYSFCFCCFEFSALTWVNQSETLSSRKEVWVNSFRSPLHFGSWPISWPSPIRDMYFTNGVRFEGEKFFIVLFSYFLSSFFIAFSDFKPSKRFQEERNFSGILSDARFLKKCEVFVNLLVSCFEQQWLQIQVKVQHCMSLPDLFYFLLLIYNDIFHVELNSARNKLDGLLKELSEKSDER